MGNSSGGYGQNNGYGAPKSGGYGQGYNQPQTNNPYQGGSYGNGGYGTMQGMNRNPYQQGPSGGGFYRSPSAGQYSGATPYGGYNGGPDPFDPAPVGPPSYGGPDPFEPGPGTTDPFQPGAPDTDPFEPGPITPYSPPGPAPQQGIPTNRQFESNPLIAKKPGVYDPTMSQGLLGQGMGK
jgi:hypothetical protein